MPERAGGMIHREHGGKRSHFACQRPRICTGAERTEARRKASGNSGGTRPLVGLDAFEDYQKLLGAVQRGYHTGLARIWHG